jgi:NADH:ubiquinone oxidoreductase subunit 4 (subunit M)
VSTVSLIAIVFSSLAALRQLDFKKLIAYSSIAHINFALFGVCSSSIPGFEGSLLLVLSHGLVASAIFITLSILYERYSTRLISYYSGLVQVMPIFTLVFFLLLLANFGLPTTSSFPAELLILIGAFAKNKWTTVLATFSIFFSTLYSL